ncbi:MAG: hypothetical protein Q8N31_13515 [Reyranella sp.]|nr:hypothetical protein [Reyranella sp.]
MANFIVSYDLNGPKPTHKEMDEHIRKIAPMHGRILETVWYLKCGGTPESIRNYLQLILGKEDRVFVAECGASAWHKLLVTNESLKNAWEKQAA